MNRSSTQNILFILMFVFLLTACVVSETIQEENEALVTDTPTSIASVSPELQAIHDLWASSSHADTYALEKGPNTYCAKCHSPANWDYTAKIDPPPNCVSCKFSFESEPRIAQGNPLVPESEWADIGCEVCHDFEGGVVNTNIGWFNTITGYHETVASATELCEKCHLDNQTLNHKRDLGYGAHATFQCTECHDAHSTRANCKECHPVVMAEESEIPSAGHNEAHAALTCIACHDASGLEVGPIEGQNLWITFRTVELLGRSQTEPYQSHSLQRAVDCTRCHFPDNPWDLTAQVTDN